MVCNLIICLLIILVIIYLFDFMNINEGFANNSSKTNIYKSVDLIPNKMLYLSPPNTDQPNVDYQDWLNEVSGYDSGTRGYDNYTYAADVASGLDTN